jgi:hypothetical protein
MFIAPLAQQLEQLGVVYWLQAVTPPAVTKMEQVQMAIEAREMRVLVLELLPLGLFEILLECFFSIYHIFIFLFRFLVSRFASQPDFPPSTSHRHHAAPRGPS